MSNLGKLPKLMDHVPVKLFPVLKESSLFSERIGPQIVALEHDHDFYEIAFVHGGTGRHCADGVATDVSRGDVFIIPRGTSHSWLNTRDLQILNLYYCPERFLSIIGASKTSTAMHCLFFSADIFKNPAMSAVTRIRCGDDSLEAIHRELADIHDYQDQEQDLQTTFNSACLLKILARLTREYFTHNSLHSGSRDMHPTVYRLLDILNQYAAMGEVPNIGAHADKLGMSLQHLTRVFSEGVGMPPFKYFNKRRLEYAKELLQKDVHTSTEIAHKLGFCDSAHFTRVFKDSFQITPSEFKKGIRARAAIAAR